MLELFKTRLRVAIWGESGFHTTKEHNRNGHLGKVPGGFEPRTPGSPVQLSNHWATTAAAEPMENLWYLCSDLLMYTVASPDPDLNPRGGGPVPNSKCAILC